MLHTICCLSVYVYSSAQQKLYHGACLLYTSRVEQIINYMYTRTASVQGRPLRPCLLYYSLMESDLFPVLCNCACLLASTLPSNASKCYSQKSFILRYMGFCGTYLICILQRRAVWNASNFLFRPCYCNQVTFRLESKPSLVQPGGREVNLCYFLVFSDFWFWSLPY